MNAVNLPLALLTVVLRRLIDKFRTTQGVVILRASAPWVVDTSLVKSCMYAYMFCAGIYYTMKHMQRGTIVKIAKKCSDSAVTIKDKCVRKGYYINRRSSLVKNLVRDRDSQQKALRYIASMTPHEITRQSSPNILTQNDVENNTEPPYENFERDLNAYSTNPYFETNNSVVRNFARPIGYQRQRHNVSAPPAEIIFEPNAIKSDLNAQIATGDGKENSPIDLETITVSDDVREDSVENPRLIRRKQRARNCLTLRGRKILKNDLSFCGDSVVRKTRSGKIYGYHPVGSRFIRTKGKA